MNKEVVTKISYYYSRRARIGQEPTLDAPSVVHTEGQMLYPGVVPESGAIIRIPTVPGAQPMDNITLFWTGKQPYQKQQPLMAPDRFLDFVVPKAVILADSEEGSIGRCEVHYVVSHQTGGIETSERHAVYVTSNFQPSQPVVVPDAVGGELDFSNIADPRGLRVDFPDARIFAGRWLCYGRDGRPKPEVSYAVHAGETTIYLWRELLEQAESGGEACIYYTGVSEYISPSEFVRIRAL